MQDKDEISRGIAGNIAKYNGNANGESKFVIRLSKRVEIVGTFATDLERDNVLEEVIGEFDIIPTGDFLY